MESIQKQLSQLNDIDQQVEARLPSTATVALTNEWHQKQSMRNYQSEHDRIRHELWNSALPFQTQEGVIHRRAELEQMGITLYNVRS